MTKLARAKKQQETMEAESERYRLDMVHARQALIWMADQNKTVSIGELMDCGFKQHHIDALLKHGLIAVASVVLTPKGLADVSWQKKQQEETDEYLEACRIRELNRLKDKESRRIEWDSRNKKSKQ